MQIKTVFLVLFCCVTLTCARHLHKKTKTLNNLLEVEDTDTLYWRNEKEAGKCKPFTTYSIRCNKCVCNADGVPSCTRKNCDGWENISKNELETSEEHRLPDRLHRSFNFNAPSQDKSTERLTPYPKYRLKQRRPKDMSKVYKEINKNIRKAIAEGHGLKEIEEINKLF